MEVSVPSTPSFTFFCCYLLVGFLLIRYAGIHSSHLLFFVIIWRGKVKWFKIEGVYSGYLKYKPIEKKYKILWICIVLTRIFHPISYTLEMVERK